MSPERLELTLDFHFAILLLLTAALGAVVFYLVEAFKKLKEVDSLKGRIEVVHDKIDFVAELSDRKTNK